jgi:hypothetical protein
LLKLKRLRSRSRQDDIEDEDEDEDDDGTIDRDEDDDDYEERYERRKRCRARHRYYLQLQQLLAESARAEQAALIAAHVHRDQLDRSIAWCIAEGLNRKQTAKFVGLHRNALRYRLQTRSSLASSRLRFSVLTPRELFDTAKLCLRLLPLNVGNVNLRGALLQQGLRVARWQVRLINRMIDPVASGLRRKRRLLRRVYNVPCSNALWHMDGCHTLVGYDSARRDAACHIFLSRERAVCLSLSFISRCLRNEQTYFLFLHRDRFDGK